MIDKDTRIVILDDHSKWERGQENGEERWINFETGEIIDRPKMLYMSIITTDK